MSKNAIEHTISVHFGYYGQRRMIGVNEISPNRSRKVYLYTQSRYKKLWAMRDHSYINDQTFFFVTSRTHKST